MGIFDRNKVHFVLSLSVFAVCLTNRSGAQQVDKKIPSISELAERFSINVIINGAEFPTETTYGQITGRDAAPESLKSYSSLFAEEFYLYPPELIKKSRLKRVIFCTQLAFAGQRRNAIPDFEHDTLYLDVERGSSITSYMRKVIHHEFFHIIDYRDDGDLYRDARWSSLNAKSFEYGTGGRNAQDLSTTSVLTNASPGFLNHYSTTGVEEDKAEVFANLIVDSDYVNTRIATDEILSAKVTLMKRLLKDFCPEMNDEFWDEARRYQR